MRRNKKNRTTKEEILLSAAIYAALSPKWRSKVISTSIDKDGIKVLCHDIKTKWSIIGNIDSLKK